MRISDWSSDVCSSDLADGNPAIRLAPAGYTHAAAVIGKLSGFVAINSAIEVDLTGQINAEVVDGTYLGAVGGQLDFMRAAAIAPGGRSVIALPATARGGTVSRIVGRIKAGIVTTPRSDRSEEHTSELQSLMRISYAVFCLKK